MTATDDFSWKDRTQYPDSVERSCVYVHSARDALVVGHAILHHAGELRVQRARRFDMRLSDETWRCHNCGADFEVPVGVDGVVKLLPGSGRRTVRTLVFNGEELHRCVAKPSTARFGGRPRKPDKE